MSVLSVLLININFSVLKGGLKKSTEVIFQESATHGVCTKGCFAKNCMTVDDI